MAQPERATVSRCRAPETCSYARPCLTMIMLGRLFPWNRPATFGRVLRVTSQDGVRGHELVLAEGARPADVVRVHREVLHVLRSSIDAAHVDAHSGDAWPAEVLHSYERALSLAQREVVSGTRSRHSDPGMGIDLDVRDDEQFKALSDLAPYTIHAEGWRDGRLIFSASDSGTALWIEVTREQEAALLSRLGQVGIPSGVLTVLSPGR